MGSLEADLNEDLCEGGSFKKHFWEKKKKAGSGVGEGREKGTSGHAAGLSSALYTPGARERPEAFTITKGGVTSWDKGPSKRQVPVVEKSLADALLSHTVPVVG